MLDTIGDPVGFKVPAVAEPKMAVEVSDIAPDFAPVNNRIFVKPDAKVAKRGGIYLPEGERPIFTGVVLSSGSVRCVAGDRIAFETMRPIEIDGAMRFFVEEKHVVGVKGGGV